MNTSFLTRPITIHGLFFNTEATKWFGYASKGAYEKANPHIVEIVSANGSKWSEKQVLRFATLDEAIKAAKMYSRQPAIRINNVK